MTRERVKNWLKFVNISNGRPLNSITCKYNLMNIDHSYGFQGLTFDINLPKPLNKEDGESEIKAIISAHNIITKESQNFVTSQPSSSSEDATYPLIRINNKM